MPVPDHMQIRLLETKGIKVAECTPDEWLQLAIEAETFAKANPLDPAAAHFYQKAQDYMKAATLAENLQQSK